MASAKNEELFWAKTFASGISDAVILLDQENRIIWWNRNAQHHFLITHQQHFQRPVTELFDSSPFTTYIHDKHPGNVEFSTRGQPNKTLSAILIPYGRIFILVIQDVSQKSHIDKIRQDFVANVSHEMRTPLTVIQGYLEMMQQEVTEVLPHWQDFINQMQSQMQRLETLLEDILFLSKIQTGELEAHDIVPIDVPVLIEELIKDAKNISNGQHHFTSSIDHRVWLAGHRKELRSCFGNLLFNAVTYSPDGGTVHISWHADENGAYFSVTDHGIGINAKHIPRLTERFYRVDKGRSRETGGTGLGLSIVKHVLLRHNATLDIQSSPGEGSTFSCVFPREAIRHNPG